MKRIAFLILVTSMLIAASPAHAQTGNAFASAACAEVAKSTGPIAPTFDKNTECGWLTVPLQHSDPAGATIQLGVVILRATGAAQRGEVAAIATAPINKEALRLAGLPWNGHTDLLAHLTGAPSVAMMFYSDALRVVLG